MMNEDSNNDPSFTIMKDTSFCHLIQDCLIAYSIEKGGCFPEAGNTASDLEQQMALLL